MGAAAAMSTHIYGGSRSMGAGAAMSARIYRGSSGSSHKCAHLWGQQP